MNIEDLRRKIEVPREAQRIIAVLEEAGFEAFAVGGCVRDSLLGREPEDWDITTEALPEKVKSLFSHTIDTGIKHGTVTVLMNKQAFEVTTYRKDGAYSDGRHPDSVDFTPSLEEDLKRRDFTINALAYNEGTGIIDLFEGVSDLENRVIRCVGEADKRFDEDALRIMRALRFAAQLSFEIEEETYAAIRKHADDLSRISMERIRVEFEKTLMSSNPGYVNEFKKTGLAKYIVGSEAEPNCFKAGLDEIYKELGKEGFDEWQKRVLRLTAFLYDMEPAEAGRVLRRLTYDNRTRQEVVKLLSHKDEYILADIKRIKKLLNKLGKDSTGLLLELNRAFLKCESATAGDMRCAQVRRETMIDDAKEVFDEILKSGEAYDISMLDINGRDLMEIGVTDGRKIGETLEELLARVIDEPQHNSKDKLAGIVRDELM